MIRGFNREWYYKHSTFELRVLNKAMIEFNREVDASGLHCPLPLLRLKKALMEMMSGDVVKVIATDPAAHLDFGVYTDQAGHQIIKFVKQSNAQIFYIKKK
jgi:tRNA 2-thiouridine synthesizing protein A